MRTRKSKLRRFIKRPVVWKSAVLAVAASILIWRLYTALFPPGPMTYCEALVARGLARDCADDPNPLPHSTSVVFTTAIAESGGQKGRVIKFWDGHSFWREHDRLRPRESTGDLFLPSFAGELAHILVYYPGPFDSADEYNLMDFATDDMRAITKRRPVKFPLTMEHPVHSDACRSTVDCIDDGRCAIRPTRPDKCVAGFTKDCLAAWSCKNRSKSETPCSVNYMTYECIW